MNSRSLVVVKDAIFGAWKVLETPLGKVSGQRIKCICTGCNQTMRDVLYDTLQKGTSYSCGCLKGTKRNKTMIKTYGVTGIAAHPDYQLLYRESLKKRHEDSNKQNIRPGKVFHYWKIIQTTDNRMTLCECTECGTIRSVNYIDILSGKSQSCGCMRSQITGKDYTSVGEKELFSFVKNYYSSTTKKRQDGRELDIFIPELNLGIEYNGLWWHSEVFKARNYHLDKTQYFASKGIRVLQIFEHEWQDRQDQVKSFLQSALKKNINKIGARKCQLVWSSSEQEITKAHSLLDSTHIQGHTNSTKYVANAYYNDELVATATFGKHHRDSTTWVLSRFTTKTNYTIQGILSKITKLASRELQSDIISWADYRLSNGNGYEKAGWQKEKLLAPDYFYFKGSKIISKQSRQKKKVKTPEGMTEAEHAKLDGLKRVYDCGKIRYRYIAI